MRRKWAELSQTRLREILGSILSSFKSAKRAETGNMKLSNIAKDAAQQMAQSSFGTQETQMQRKGAKEESGRSFFVVLFPLIAAATESCAGETSAETTIIIFAEKRRKGNHHQRPHRREAVTAGRQTGKQADRQADRRTDKKPRKQTEKQFSCLLFLVGLSLRPSASQPVRLPVCRLPPLRWALFLHTSKTTL